MIDKLTPEQKKENKENAKNLCNAIKKLANNENSLQNFQWYLEQHFETWLQKYCNTPDGLANGIESFSNIQ